MSQEYQRSDWKESLSKETNQTKDKKPQNGRVIALQTIWSMTAGMIALDWAIWWVTNGTQLPALAIVLIGAIVGTVAVWGFGWGFENNRKRDTSAELKAAQQRLRELEERLANVETISVFEQRLAEETAARQMGRREPVPERDSAGV